MECTTENMEAVAKFSFEKFMAATHLPIGICERIEASLSSDDTDEAIHEYDEIANRLKITHQMAIMLMALAYNDGFLGTAEDLSKSFHLAPAEIEVAIAQLIDSGLMEFLSDNAGIILTSKAIQMLEEGESWENIIQKKFIDILSYSCDGDEDEDEFGIASTLAGKISSYMKDYPESRMSKFYEENHMELLNNSEFEQFIHLCCKFVCNFTSGSKANRKNPAVKTMLKRGWAMLYAAQGDNDSDLIKQNNIILSVGVCRKLFGGCEDLIDVAAIMGQSRVTLWNEIEEKQLFYNAEDENGIARLRMMADVNEYQRIAAALKENHLNASVSGILHGAPGTGKTELVRQIARETHRNLIIVDASKLTGSYCGEAERNYRDLFRNFRYIEAISYRAPILFIDEADGILGKRSSDMSTRGDRSANTVQNIILEELNDFEGILLATTNIVSNLDDAMERRFLLKIEFHIPDENTRRKIWMSKLPKAKDEDIAVVAKEFNFAGGHIDKVAANAIIESIMDRTNTITLESIIKFSKDESTFANKDRRAKVGF